MVYLYVLNEVLIDNGCIEQAQFFVNFYVIGFNCLEIIGVFWMVLFIVGYYFFIYDSCICVGFGNGSIGMVCFMYSIVYWVVGYYIYKVVLVIIGNVNQVGIVQGVYGSLWV